LWQVFNSFEPGKNFFGNIKDLYLIFLLLGCPQRWAIQEGLGAALIEKNSLICEMVKETRKCLNYDPDFTVAVKIRLHENIKYDTNENPH
jgi:hypothetical protein